MHPLFIFLYCWAYSNARVTPGDIILINNMVQLFFPRVDAKMLDDEDALVSVTLLHKLLEPSTCDVQDIMNRFSDVSAAVWGPAAWELLHSLSMGCNFAQVPYLLEIWQRVLPCHLCRKHLREHLLVTRHFGSTSAHMYTYTVALHNAVNVSLGKPIYSTPTKNLQ